MTNDHDPNIKVWLTGPEDQFCIAVQIGPDVRVFLHVRSAVDLAKKINKGCLDWINKQTEILLDGR